MGLDPLAQIKFRMFVSIMIDFCEQVMNFQCMSHCKRGQQHKNNQPDYLEKPGVTLAINHRQTRLGEGWRRQNVPKRKNSVNKIATNLQYILPLRAGVPKPK
jgi:hypothetical protein